jgi:hypothetical protein
VAQGAALKEAVMLAVLACGLARHGRAAGLDAADLDRVAVLEACVR